MRNPMPGSLALVLLVVAGQAAIANPSISAEPAREELVSSDYRQIESLLEDGRGALRQGRMFSPAGDNALEYTVRALELDRRHPLAQAAMDDLYSFVTSAIDGAIERRNYAEARRLLDLLERGRPESVVARSLRARLAQVAGSRALPAG